MPLDVAILPAFLTAAILLAVSPGPDLLLITSHAGTKGFRAGALIAVGIFLAGVIQTGLVAMGLAALMESTPRIATAIRVIGALYLLVLGLKLLLARPEGDSRSIDDGLVDTRAAHLITRGLANNLLNPKALLFFSVFLPQFTTQAGPTSVQLVILGLLLSATAFVVNLAAAAGSSQIAGRFRSGLARSGRRVEQALGVMFLGLSVRLVTTR